MSKRTKLIIMYVAIGAVIYWLIYKFVTKKPYTAPSTTNPSTGASPDNIVPQSIYANQDTCDEYALRNGYARGTWIAVDGRCQIPHKVAG